MWAQSQMELSLAQRPGAGELLASPAKGVKMQLLIYNFIYKMRSLYSMADFEGLSWFFLLEHLFKKSLTWCEKMTLKELEVSKLQQLS